MKVIKYLIGLAAISGILLFGLKYYTEGSYGEIPGILDQLNPLVEKGEVYVKTQKPEEVNEYGTDRKSTRLNSSHSRASRMPSSA